MKNDKINNYINEIIDIATLEKSIYNIYNELNHLNNTGCLNQELAYDIVIEVFQNDYFIECLLKLFKTDTNKDIVKLFLNLSMLGFVFLGINGIKQNYNDSLVKKVKSIFFLWKQKLNDELIISQILFKIIEILQDQGNNRKFQSNVSFYINDIYKFFDTLQIKSNILGIVFILNLNFDYVLKHQLDINHSIINTKNNPSIIKLLQNTYGSINRIYGSINSYRLLWLNHFPRTEEEFKLSYRSFNSPYQKIVYIILNEVVRDLIEEEDFGTQVLTKIDYLIEKSNKIDSLIFKHLNYFNPELKNSPSVSYVDKIYFITVKFISVAEKLNNSSNNEWKIKVLVREMFNWLEELYEIVNKFSLIDDWDSISGYLEEESSSVEWKGSFLTPLETKNPKFRSENMKKIGETIIAMMNNEGGIILVGCIEHRDKILEVDGVIEKLNSYFFDIAYEFKKYRFDIDMVTRQIQDIIKADLGSSISIFDKYFKIIPVNLNSRGKIITIYKIIVERSEHTLYSIKDSKYLFLRKRVNKQNEIILPLLKDGYENNNILPQIDG